MNSTPQVPFLDLVTPHLEMEEEFVELFRSIVRSASFIGGPIVETFERGFASFCETKQSVAVNSGTDALRFAFIAAGIKPGEAIITVPNTFIATTEAISQAGAQPEFVDVDERTYNLDPEKLRLHLQTCDFDDATGRPISRRTGTPIAAIVPVHLYGQMADMDAILQIAREYKLIVIEDACQAHGAEYFSRRDQKWYRAGSMGVAAAFSFYPGKNLGACGEAGAVTTNDEGIACNIRMLRDHGQAQKYYHAIEGYNGRLDTIQCAILNAKLCKLADWNSSRRDHAARYSQLLSPLIEDMKLPFEAEDCRGVYHLYVIEVDDREGLKQHLANAGVNTAIHYPVPLHLQEAYKNLGYKNGQFPVTERAASRILSLPMFPQLTLDQQRRTSDAITEFLPARQGKIESCKLAIAATP